MVKMPPRRISVGLGWWRGQGTQHPAEVEVSRCRSLGPAQVENRAFLTSSW